VEGTGGGGEEGGNEWKAYDDLAHGPIASEADALEHGTELSVRSIHDRALLILPEKVDVSEKGGGEEGKRGKEEEEEAIGTSLKCTVKRSLGEKS